MKRHRVGSGQAGLVIAVLMMGIWHAEALAAVDGYGNTVISAAQTGSAYMTTTCTTPLPPDDTYCSDNPFVAYDSAGSNYTFIDPRATATGQTITNNYVGQTASGNNITTNAPGITIFEGNDASPITVVADGAGAYSALYKNYASNANISSTNGGITYLTANDANGATLSTDTGSAMYVNGDAADNAVITNAGGSTFVIDGSSDIGATIDNDDSSTMTIIHSDVTNATIRVNGGAVNAYGSQASGATLTVAQGATLAIADCSAAVGCRDTRTTTFAGASPSVTNSGTVKLSGTIDAGTATITNTATGVIDLSGVTLSGGTYLNDGLVNVSTGTNTVPANVTGTGAINIESGATLVVDPAATITSSSGFTANGGTLQLAANLAAQTANAMTVGSTTLGSAPVTLSINQVNAGSATTGNGILVVRVTGGSGNSAANVFQMAPFTNNGFTYSLVRGADGNWYLQTLSAALPSTPVPTLGDAVAAILGLLVIALGGLGLRRRVVYIP